MNKKEILDNLFTVYEYAKNHTDQQTIEKINSLFPKEDIIVRNESVNQAYYKYSVEHIYIKNGNGIYISVGSGAGDIFGKNHSHGEGLDISICSSFMDDDIVLFYDGENKVNSKSNFENKIKNMIHEPLSVETIIDRINNYPEEKFLYNILPDEYKKTEEIIQVMIEQMDTEAKIQHQNLVDYSNISPNGVDVFILPQEEIFINMMKDYDYTGNELLISQIKNFAAKNYQEYFNKEIQRLDKALYMINHEKEYRHNFKMDANIRFTEEIYDSNKEDLNKFQKEISELEKGIKLNQRQISQIKNKKYHLLTILAERKNDKNKLSKLEDQIKSYEKDILDKKRECGYLIENIENAREEIEDFRSQIIQLKYSYFDPLNDVDDEMYHHSVYDREDFEHSMEYMKSKIGDIITKRQMYQKILDTKTVDITNHDYEINTDFVNSLNIDDLNEEVIQTIKI